MTEIHALRQKGPLVKEKRNENTVELGISKKRPAEDAKKKKADKKRALKRL